MVDVRTAEALKYACNAFHATKVSFANEMGRIFRHYGVDSREVMRIFVQDTSLNISPYYLKPGFAFGGSCLPKDLRSVLHLARVNNTDLPLLAGTLATNERTVSDVVDRVVAGPGREIALLGLSFKHATDDLRESPNVELAERLIGKGYNLRIYDAIVNPSRLVGANLRHVEVQAAAPAAGADRRPGRRRSSGADLALVSATDSAAVERPAQLAAGPDHRPERPARRRRRGAARIRRSGLVSGPRVLIIIQNLWVPFDRRVWLECKALVASGYDVTVVCPKGPGDPSYQVIDGVTVHQYKAYAPGGSKLGFVAEYAYSFLMTLRLVLRARKAGKFQVMQACNPPDIFWPIAMLLRRLDGTRFVFDHHDLCPELFQSRFGGTTSLPYKGLRFLERMTHRTADHVISTNDSYRRIAITRSGKANHDVTVVRTGPDPDKLRRGASGRVAPPRPPLPGHLHRRDGSAGRRRHRRPRGGHDRQQARPDRHRVHADGWR